MRSNQRHATKVDLFFNLGALAFAGVLLFCTDAPVSGAPGDTRRDDGEPRPADPIPSDELPSGDPDVGDIDYGDIDYGDIDYGDIDYGDIDYGDIDYGDYLAGDAGADDCSIVSPVSTVTYRRREPVRLAVDAGVGTVTSVAWSSDVDGTAFTTGDDVTYLDLSVGSHELTAIIEYSDFSTCTTRTVQTTVVANHGIVSLTYADNGNGTIFDGAGLTWQQQDDDSAYNWYEAAGVFDATHNTATTDVCGSLGLGAPGDWRLPTRRELLRTVNYGVTAPTTDPLFIGTSDFDPYWSNDVRTGGDTYAWAVSFQTGGTVSYIERYADYPAVMVRCVRGTMPVGPYMVDNGDGTATDEATGLMWQIADADARIWTEALDYCDTSTVATHDDWRLPNVMELESIVDITLTGSMAPSPFALQSAGYATSTEAFGQESWLAWQVSFGTGEVGYNGKTDANRVLCVRLP